MGDEDCTRKDPLQTLLSYDDASVVDTMRSLDGAAVRGPVCVGLPDRLTVPSRQKASPIRQSVPAGLITGCIGGESTRVSVR